MMIFPSDLKKCKCVFFSFQAGPPLPHQCSLSSTALLKLDLTKHIARHESPSLCIRLSVPTPGQSHQAAGFSTSPSPARAPLVRLARSQSDFSCYLLPTGPKLILKDHVSFTTVENLSSHKLL